MKWMGAEGSGVEGDGASIKSFDKWFDESVGAVVGWMDGWMGGLQDCAGRLLFHDFLGLSFIHFTDFTNQFEKNRLHY